MRWGDIGVLEYGRALRDYRRGVGRVRVYGTNGAIGWTTEAQGAGPSVIVGRKGMNRGVHYARGSFWVIDTAYWLRPLVDLDPRWAYYQLRTQDINGQDSGSAIPSLSRADFASLPVRVPPIDEQRAIAHLLGSLDDKMEANERLRFAVDAFLRAVFEDLAAPALAAVSNNAGVIDGWRIEALGDALDVIETGSRPKGGVARFTSGVPSIGAESIVGLAQYDFSKAKFVPPDFFEGMRRGVVADRDVLLYKDGGRPGQFEPHVSMLGEGFPFREFCINEHVYRLRAQPRLSQEYLFFWLSSGPIMEAMRRSGTGVAIPGLNSTAVKSLPIGVPPAAVAKSFDSLAGPLVGVALRCGRQSVALSKLRDALLPRLVTGELRLEELSLERTPRAVVHR